MDPVPELDQRLLVEPDPGDVAQAGLVEEGLGRGAEGGPLGEEDELLELGRQVEVLAGSTRWLTSRTARRPAARPTDSSAYE